MITQAQLDDIVVWKGLKDFGRFMLSHCDGDRLPDYKRVDLMQVPALVPYIWVYDLRTEDNVQRLQMGFAGERHSEMHGRNVSGKSDAEAFSAYGFSDDVISHYHKAIRERKVAYNRRFAEYNDGFRIEHHNLETLFFPCSPDGVTVDWGIGCLNWETAFEQVDKVFAYF